MKKIIYVFTLLMALAANAYALPSGGPHLWLSTDANNFNEGGLNYVGDSTNPWMADSYNAGSGVPFRLYLYNALNNARAQAAINVSLLVAIHSGDSGVVEIKDASGNVTLIPAFTYNNINPYYGGGYHGVYQNLGGNGDESGDAMFALYNTNITLAQNQSTYFDITTNGFREVHFDAFSSNGYYNPASHDVTTTPEPATAALLGLGLLGLFGLRKKRSA